MNIIVCIKQVPETTEVRINPETNTLIREGVKSIINPFDMYAIEEGVRLKEKFGGKVTVVTMGPPQAEQALREALSMGIDEAVLISDRAFAGSDTWATSYTLSCAIKQIGEYDIILCGKQASDGDTAQVGPGIATRLGYAQLTLVDRIESLDLQAKKVRVRRKLEGRHEIVEASLPAMITVIREINTPRYPTVPMRLMAADAAVTLWDNKQMKLNEMTIGLKGSATQVRRIFSPERAKGEILGDGAKDPEQAAHILLDMLVEKDVISL